MFEVIAFVTYFLVFFLLTYITKFKCYLFVLPPSWLIVGLGVIVYDPTYGLFYSINIIISYVFFVLLVYLFIFFIVFVLLDYSTKGGFALPMLKSKSIEEWLGSEEGYIKIFELLGLKEQKKDTLLGNLKFVKGEILKFTKDELRLIKAYLSSFEKGVTQNYFFSAVIGLFGGTFVFIINGELKKFNLLANVSNNSWSEKANFFISSYTSMLNLIFLLLFAIVVIYFVSREYQRLRQKVSLLKEIISICIDDKIR